MSNLTAAYLNELYKVSKKKKILVAAVLSVVAVTLAALIVSSVNNFMGIRLAGVAGFFVLVLQVLNYTLIPLFTAFVCIDMFSGEFGGEHTIKLTLTRPVSRFKVFLSKVLAVATFIAANLVFVMLLSYAASFFIKGANVSFGNILMMYVASFFPLMVFALMVILIANVARGSASAFMLSLVAFLATIALEIVSGDYGSFFFTSAFGWYGLFWGSFINIAKIIRVFLILLGYGLVFFSAGYYLFDKKSC